jgi:DNA-binding CsgD family transcriptional regulator
MNGLLKISLKVGAITAGAVILYEAVDQLYLYNYFRYEYYITGTAVISLIAGVLLSRRYFRDHTLSSSQTNVIDALTAKELHILQLICHGKTNKEIAAGNFVELSTVKTHINHIYNKIGAKNRREAAKICENYLVKQKSTFSPPLEI